MNSVTIQIRPTSPRTLVPITVDLDGPDAGTARLSVRGADGKDVAINAVPSDGGHLRGTFWLEQPGDYAVTAITSSGTILRPFRVKEQLFLPFPVEFGIFCAALFVAAGGLILWFRSRKKAGSISASSPS